MSIFDCDDAVIRSISDWTEVSEEDYQLLKSNLWRLDSYKIRSILIEQPLEQSNWIDKSIKQILQHIERQTKEEQQRKDKLKASRELAESKRRQKQIEKAKKLLQELGEV